MTTSTIVTPTTVPLVYWVLVAVVHVKMLILAHCKAMDVFFAIVDQITMVINAQVNLWKRDTFFFSP